MKTKILTNIEINEIRKNLFTLDEDYLVSIRKKVNLTLLDKDLKQRLNARDFKISKRLDTSIVKLSVILEYILEIEKNIKKRIEEVNKVEEVKGDFRERDLYDEEEKEVLLEQTFDGYESEMTVEQELSEQEKLAKDMRILMTLFRDYVTLSFIFFSIFITVFVLVSIKNHL